MTSSASELKPREEKEMATVTLMYFPGRNNATFFGHVSLSVNIPGIENPLVYLSFNVVHEKLDKTQSALVKDSPDLLSLSREQRLYGQNIAINLPTIPKDLALTEVKHFQDLDRRAYSLTHNNCANAVLNFLRATSLPELNIWESLAILRPQALAVCVCQAIFDRLSADRVQVIHDPALSPENKIIKLINMDIKRLQLSSINDEVRHITHLKVTSAIPKKIADLQGLCITFINPQKSLEEKCIALTDLAHSIQSVTAQHLQECLDIFPFEKISDYDQNKKRILLRGSVTEFNAVKKLDIHYCLEQRKTLLADDEIDGEQRVFALLENEVNLLKANMALDHNSVFSMLKITSKKKIFIHQLEDIRDSIDENKHTDHVLALQKLAKLSAESKDDTHAVLEDCLAHFPYYQVNYLEGQRDVLHILQAIHKDPLFDQDAKVLSESSILDLIAELKSTLNNINIGQMPVKDIPKSYHQISELFEKTIKKEQGLPKRFAELWLFALSHPEKLESIITMWQAIRKEQYQNINKPVKTFILSIDRSHYSHLLQEDQPGETKENRSVSTVKRSSK